MVQFNGRWLPPEDSGEGGDPEKDFPIRDTYTDCAGRERYFVISPFPVGLGFALQAEEEGTDGYGFFFREFDATSPYLALGRLRGRIQKALSTRHIEQRRPGDFQMTHGTVQGRITYDSGQVAFVIDGQFLTLPQLGKMLETFEGSEFSIKISDRCKSHNIRALRGCHDRIADPLDFHLRPREADVITSDAYCDAVFCVHEIGSLWIEWL